MRDTLLKISEKSGNFDVVFLLGKVFDKEKPFNEVFSLEKIPSKFIIFDSSQAGIIIKHKFSSPFNLTENIILLDRKGVLDIEGIKVAYLSGLENENFLVENKASLYDYCQAIYTGENFNKDDINHLLKLKIGNSDESNNIKSKIDILLTHSIPSVCFQELLNSKTSPLGSSSNVNLKISKESLNKFSSYACNLIAKIICPRYHIVSIDDFFYERNPYLNILSHYDSTGQSNSNANSNNLISFTNENNQGSKIMTRFINLSYVINIKLNFIR